MTDGCLDIRLRNIRAHTIRSWLLLQIREKHRHQPWLVPFAQSYLSFHLLSPPIEFSKIIKFFTRSVKSLHHNFLKALSSPSGGPVQLKPTVRLTLSHWYCLGAVLFKLFITATSNNWMLRQGDAALHCSVVTTSPRIVPEKSLK